PQIVLRMNDMIRAANPDTVQMSYGLGWVIQDYRGQLLVSHGGVVDGFRTHITLVPQAGIALALMCNRHQTWMNLALSNSLVDRIVGLPPRDWNAYFTKIARREEELKREARHKRDEGRRPDQPATRPLADYAGVYEHPAYGQMRIRKENGRLL